MKEEILRKCPNCGASIEHNYNHKCPYCRTFLHMTDETIKKINNCDYRIDDVDIEKNPLEWGYILTVRGWTTPKMHFYEENNNDAFIISGDDIPKRVGYKISLPQELLFHGNLERVIDFVLNSMPPDLCNGYNENKIIDKVYNFFMRRHTQI